MSGEDPDAPAPLIPARRAARARPADRTVWNDYNVQVEASSPNADIVHSSVIYFIGPGGQQRFVASPVADHTASGASYLPADQVSAWGRGIAQVARTLVS